MDFKFAKMKGYLTTTQILFLGSLVCLLSSSIFLTGSSYLKSDIIPISINEKGEILCKTRFTKNEMGAHRAMKVKYGFCVISEGEMIQFRGKVIDPDKLPDEYEPFSVINHWDSIFKAKITQKQLSELVKALDFPYSFSSCNADSFLVDKVMSIEEFKKSKEVNLKNNHQKGLYGALSGNYFDTNKIHLLYDFGKVFLLKNVDSYEIENRGAGFDYYHGWINDEGKEVNIGFEDSTITGVLFKK